MVFRTESLLSRKSYLWLFSCMVFITYLRISPPVYAGTINDYNPWNVSIPDNGPHMSSDLSLSGAPSGAVITKVKVYYEIRHTYPGDLDVWLTTYYGGRWHDYYLYHQGDLGGADDIVETRDNLHYWDGASPNQTWYLSVQDRASGYVGYIDFFELWVTYNVPPDTPSSPDPADERNNVSRTTDLDWACSDSDGDTIYYTVYFEKNDSSPDNIIKNNATGSYADPGTLDYSSHYYWRVKADDHKGGITWGPVWDFYTEPNPNGNLDVYVRNWDGSWPGDSGRVVLYRGANYWQSTISGDGIAHFSDKLAVTDYWYEVYYDGARGEEYWGDKTNVSIVAGTMNTSNFTRFYPYATNVILKNHSTGAVINPGASIVLGATVRAEVTVYNGLAGQALNCYVQTLFDRDTTEPYDGTPTSATLSVPAQDSRLFTTTFAPDQTGTYSKALKVTSVLGPGPTMTDGWAWDSAFAVSPGLSITGRIAYHSYTTYDSMDGMLRMCEMPEQNVYTIPEVMAETNHQMNPHFSFDGSLVTFMAVPTDSPASPGVFRPYLEVYLYDFTTSTVLRLTDNSVPDEDPKFSPLGTKIVFKRNGNIHTMDIDGNNAQPLTNTTIEESGPRYSPSALGKIAYWVTYYESGYKYERIWWMKTDGSSQQQLVPDSDVRIMYYPVFIDSERLAYTRWRTNTDELDQIHIHNLTSGADDSVLFKDETANDSDAFPIEGNLLGFSSTRIAPGAKGGYDLYIGDLQTGQTWPLSLASTNIDDLGGCYTSVNVPPSARTVTVDSMPSGAPFTISGTGSNGFEYTGTTPWSNSTMRPGHYTITWGNLSGYITPPPDTQYLVSNGISFTGTYTTAIVGDFCGADFGPADGYVDVWDLMAFADHWHTKSSDSNWDAKFDLAGTDFGDPDGYVDVWDLMVFADHWHEGQKPE